MTNLETELKNALNPSPKLLLDEVSDKPHEEILRLYKSDNPTIRLAATLINAIALKGSKHFSISYRVFLKLLERDTLAEAKTPSGYIYKAMLSGLFKAKIMTLVKAPSLPGKGRSIGIYEVREDILSLKSVT
jgi:hypothetical protein